MRPLIICSVFSLAAVAHADGFPWSGERTLTAANGQTLTWTVQRLRGEVLVTGTHPKWHVEHRARPDGTPVSTVKRVDGVTTRIAYSAAGATLERTDAKQVMTKVVIHEQGLWDADTLDARLAGISWARGKKVRLRVVDIDAADGSVVPLVAEYVGEEACGAAKCHHVHLALDDFRPLFAPTFEYRYSTAEGAKYVQHDGDGLRFVAPP